MRFSSPRIRRGLVARSAVVLSMVTVVVAVVGNSEREPLALAAAEAESHESPLKFNKDGELIRPTGYREWIYVGTPVTPNDMNRGKAPFPEFHAVYIDPKSWKSYKETGEYPDGTVLVKELTSVGGKRATSGKGYFMGDFIGLEVAVKDKQRFKDEPGYWSYFSFGHKYPLAEKAKAEDTAERKKKENRKDGRTGRKEKEK